MTICKIEGQKRPKEETLIQWVRGQLKKSQIAPLVKLQQELEGEQRDRLLEEISCLDVIAEVMIRVVEMMDGQ